MCLSAVVLVENMRRLHGFAAVEPHAVVYARSNKIIGLFLI
jgi:hypothetical protein